MEFNLDELGVSNRGGPSLNWIYKLMMAWNDQHPVKTHLDALRRSQAFWKAVGPILHTDREAAMLTKRTRVGELNQLHAAIMDRLSEIRRGLSTDGRDERLAEMQDLRSQAEQIRVDLVEIRRLNSGGSPDDGLRRL